MKQIELIFISWLMLTIALRVEAQMATDSNSFPGPIGGASFIYHPKSKALLLIGGTPEIRDSVRSNVWKWNGVEWREIIASGPGARSFFQGDLNRNTGSIEMFGGVGEADGKFKGDTWSFDGLKWSSIATNNIGTRDHHKMIYADHLNAFVLYGGKYNERLDPDTATWLLKNGIFIKLDIKGPGNRYHSGLVYDRARKKVMLYGGGTKPEEQWEFDGRAWVRVNTSNNPGKKLYHHMIYDAKHKRVILHGGWINQDPRDSANGKTPATWSWDGIQWRLIDQQDVFPIAMGFDENRNVIVAYGYDKPYGNKAKRLGVWEMSDDTWKKIADYGQWHTEEYLRKWLADNPNDLQTLMKYADILQWEKKEYAEAESAYKKILKASPGRTDLYRDLAVVLGAQGKFEEADRYLAELGVDLSLQLANNRRTAGLLHQDRKLVEAMHFYQKIIQLGAGGQDCYNLATAYAMTGNKDQSFAFLDKAISLGLSSKADFDGNSDLSGLKNDPRWTKLMARLK